MRSAIVISYFSIKKRFAESNKRLNELQHSIGVIYARSAFRKRGEFEIICEIFHRARDYRNRRFCCVR